MRWAWVRERVWCGRMRGPVTPISQLVVRVVGWRCMEFMSHSRVVGGIGAGVETYTSEGGGTAREYTIGFQDCGFAFRP
jgi:hypothetical protein